MAIIKEVVHMIIIVVGPDGAGKTSLCKHLEKMGYKYIKRDKPESQEEKDTMLNCYMAMANIEGNQVYDRYAYCERVYGTIMRDENVITDEMLRFLEKTLVGKAMIIHATDTLDNLWERCQVRGEDYVTEKETLGKIRESYYDVLSRSTLPVVEYVIGKSLF